MDVNELDYEMIGKRIRAERIKKGWQQAELAFRSTYPPDQVPRSAHTTAPHPPQDDRESAAWSGASGA